MTDSKKKDLQSAISVLRMMFEQLEEKPGDVIVGELSSKEVITVVIRGACYDVNVECENIRQMVKSVVDRVILKI